MLGNRKVLNVPLLSAVGHIFLLFATSSSFQQFFFFFFLNLTSIAFSALILQELLKYFL